MNAARISLHSLLLTTADIAGIAGGAVVAFSIVVKPNQIWLQLPAAVVLSLVLFWAWILLLRVLGFRGMQFRNLRELVSCLSISMLWAPAVFVPLHYFTQGYVTSVGNVVALVLYQVPVNAVALFTVWGIQRSGGEVKMDRRPLPEQANDSIQLK